jgi:hypothetical protein
MITIALLFLAINVLVEGRSASGQGSVIVIYVRDAGFIPQSEFRGFMGDTSAFCSFHFDFCFSFDSFLFNSGVIVIINN